MLPFLVLRPPALFRDDEVTNGNTVIAAALSKEVKRLEHLKFFFEMPSGRWLQSDMADDSVEDLLCSTTWNEELIPKAVLFCFVQAGDCLMLLLPLSFIKPRCLPLMLPEQDISQPSVRWPLRLLPFVLSLPPAPISYICLQAGQP